MVFVVRASFDADGLLRGVLVHSESGRKQQFEGLAELGDAIAAMAGSGGRSASGLEQLERGKS